MLLFIIEGFGFWMVEIYGLFGVEIVVFILKFLFVFVSSVN